MFEEGRRKRLLAIVTTPFLEEKGSSLRALGILKSLATEYAVDVVTYPHGRDPALPGTMVHRTTSSFRPRLRAGRPSLRRVVLDVLVLALAIRLSWQNRYQVVHCEDFEALAIGRLVRLFRPRARLVFDVHNPVSENLLLRGAHPAFARLAGLIERFLIGPVDSIILNSHVYLSDRAYRSKYRFVHYDQVSLEARPPHFDIPTPYIVYAGNFEAYQGVESLLSAYETVKPEFGLVLVGDSRGIDYAATPNVASQGKVLFTGRLPVEETNYLIQNALCFVVPRIDKSRVPSFKFAHALAQGTPVIARRRASITHMLTHGVDTLLFESEEELAEILHQLDRDIGILDCLREGVVQRQLALVREWRIGYFLQRYQKAFCPESTAELAWLPAAKDRSAPHTGATLPPLRVAQTRFRRFARIAKSS